MRCVFSLLSFAHPPLAPPLAPLSLPLSLPLSFPLLRPLVCRVWEEALGPDVTSDDVASPAFMAAQRLQVREMVRASYSHPSVILHGFFNEGPGTDPKACSGFRELASEIRSLVPPSHRMVTWASSAKTRDECLESADVLAFNEYPGWYTESPGALGEVNETWANLSDWAAAHFPTKPFLISETGGGAIFEWHNASALILPMPPKWSQEYQAILVGADVMAAFSLPHVSGISIWQFNDIKADGVCSALRKNPHVARARHTRISCSPPHSLILPHPASSFLPHPSSLILPHPLSLILPHPPSLIVPHPPSSTLIHPHPPSSSLRPGHRRCEHSMRQLYVRVCI